MSQLDFELGGLFGLLRGGVASAKICFSKHLDS